MERSLEMAKILTFILALAATFSLSAQNFEYKWQRVKMDSVYESKKIYEVDKIVAAHQEAMTSLMEVVIYADDEIEKKQPESALSNIAADMLLYGAESIIDNGLPIMSLTNFGGIRNNFPKGAVRVYDIYSTFPFNNYIVVVELKGKYIRKILDGFVSREKFEALGGVKVEVDDGKLEKCLIGGVPLEDDKMYNLVTIDFLLDGGDRFRLEDNAKSVTRTNLVMRDVAVRYLRELSEQGVVLVNKRDGRVSIDD